MRFPTGGKARGPRGMIRCDSGADSIVWMKEDKIFRISVIVLVDITIILKAIKRLRSEFGVFLYCC